MGRALPSGAFMEGTLNTVAHTHPARIPGTYPNEGGFPLGKDTHLMPRSFDHAWMRHQRITGSPSLLLTGDMGSAKTTVAKYIARRSWMNNVRGGRRARLALDITKPGDYEDFVHELGGEIVDMKTEFGAGINILDPKLPLQLEDHLANLNMFLIVIGSFMVRV